MPRKSRLLPMMLLVCGSILLGACAVRPPAPVPEIRPGILMGYLSAESYPDSLALLPPVPDVDSIAHAHDGVVSDHNLPFRGSARWLLAAEDNELRFPAAAGTFSCALNAPVTEADTPRLYLLLRRSLTDAGLATYRAKNHYQRKRPFTVNGAPICAPDAEREMLANDGSYPSGHAAVGWAWALILTELAPERADAILARGREFGQSRVVCNVHWQSDVIEGRAVGAAAVARLHAEPQFQADVASARRELDAVRAKGLGPTRDCAAEAAALAERAADPIWPMPR